MPLAVVLPETTEQVAAVVRFCHANGVRVVPRGAGTSLSGGALPLADAVVVGLMRMNRILDIDYADRCATGRQGSPISDYQCGGGTRVLLCARSVIAARLHDRRQRQYELRRRPLPEIRCHCQHLLGLKIVTVDGEILDIGGEHLDAAGYDWLGLLTGSEGQLALVTEVTVRILRGPEGARAMLAAFRSNEVAGACVDSIISSGIIPVALEFMDRPAIHACEDFAHAGYPLDAEAMLIIEVEGSADEQDDLLERLSEICRRHDPISLKVSQSAAESLAIWKGRKGAFGAVGRISPDYLCMDGVIPTSRLPDVLRRIGEMSDAYGLKVANIFHAGDGNLHPLIMFDANVPESFHKAEEFRCGNPETVRRGRWLPDRRAWRGGGETRPDAGAVRGARTGAAAADQDGVRSGVAAQSAQGFSAGCRAAEGGVTVQRGDPITLTLGASHLDLSREAGEVSIAAAVADAAKAGEPLLVCGNGTKIGMLRPVQQRAACPCATTRASRSMRPRS